MLTRRKQTVSLCMIVRNEEQNLAECLTPVADLFDEIVIVDTGSQDKTREIAARFTPHVYGFEWCDSFSAARNESLRHAHGDWIFWLDADDRIRPDNIDKLRDLLATLGDRPRVFLMQAVSRWWDECEDAWAVDHPRLFRRNPELGWKGHVHEQLWPEPRHLGYETVQSGIQIEHLGYQDRQACLRKRQRKLRLMRMDYAENPDDPSTLYHLGVTYAGNGNLALARQHLERIVQLQREPAEYMRRVLSALATLASQENKFAESLEVIDRALVWFPNDEQLLYVKAQVLYEVQQYEAAANVLHTIISGDRPPRLGSLPADIKGKLAPRMLGAALRMQGEYLQAAAVLVAAVQKLPADTQSWFNLGLVYLDLQAPRQLEAVLQRLRSCPQGGIFATALLAMWYLRHSQLEQAEALIELLISEAPRMALPRMLQAELLSRQGAPLEAQSRVLRDLLRLQPANTEARRWLQKVEDAQRTTWGALPESLGTSIILSPGMPVG